MAVLQVRMDDELKYQASEIYEELGMDLCVAVRIFLKKSILVGGLPFDLTIDEKVLEEKMKKNSVIAKYGDKYMTLDEINEEIRKAREEKSK